MTEQNIGSNLTKIRARINDACLRAGRDPADVKLVAVTKYVDADKTLAVVNAGQNVLGESRPQVLWEKANQLGDQDIEWHLIGHLQRNKVNRSIGLCALVHSVDSERLLDAIQNASKQSGSITKCLLEVNISGEPTKHGFQPAQIESALVKSAGLPNVKIQGFMGMASLGGDLGANRQEFTRLRELRERFQSFQSDNIELSELSMGMSGDFEMAIEEGATIVRIGSILFEGVS